MIEFSQVSKKFGNGALALDDVSFRIEKGEFAYIIGPTGSGKTTIFRLLIHDLIPSAGEVMIGEWHLSKLSNKKIPELRRRVGVIFQDLKLLMDRTVMENVILPLQISGIKENEARKKAGEILLQVGLFDKQNQFPAQLSGGEKQRIAIARGLIFEPEVLLADEPTGNLDIDTSLQIIDIFESINQAKGTTILIATHSTEIIAKTKRRIIKLSQGKIVDDTNPPATSMLQEEPSVPMESSPVSIEEQEKK